jgi:hypothetical protein
MGRRSKGLQIRTNRAASGRAFSPSSANKQQKPSPKTPGRFQEHYLCKLEAFMMMIT